MTNFITNIYKNINVCLSVRAEEGLFSSRRGVVDKSLASVGTVLPFGSFGFVWFIGKEEFELRRTAMRLKWPGLLRSGWFSSYWSSPVPWIKSSKRFRVPYHTSFITFHS